LIVIDVDNWKLDKVIPLPEGSSPPSDACGIHAIDINPSKTKLITGGNSVNDMAVFSLPDMKPVGAFQGHSNWIFDLKFISDELAVTASRDTTLKVWNVDKGPEDALLFSRAEHAKKIRALAWCKPKNQLTSLSSDKGQNLGC